MAAEKKGTLAVQTDRLAVEQWLKAGSDSIKSKSQRQRLKEWLSSHDSRKNYAMVNYAMPEDKDNKTLKCPDAPTPSAPLTAETHVNLAARTRHNWLLMESPGVIMMRCYCRASRETLAWTN
jgi:hypothetical protein